MKPGIPERLEECAKVFSGSRDPTGKSELARRSGIPLRTLNKYMAGMKLPLDRAAAITKAAGKSLQWLATGDGHELATDLPLRRLPSAEQPSYEMPRRLGLAEDPTPEYLPAGQPVDTQALAESIALALDEAKDRMALGQTVQIAKLAAFCYGAVKDAPKGEDGRPRYDREELRRLLRLVP